MSGKPKILFVCDSREKLDELFGAAADDYEWVVVRNPMRALAYLTREQFEGVFVSKDYLRQAFEVGKLLQNEQILEGMPDGVVLLDSENTILWANDQVRRWSGQERLDGVEFLQCVGESGDSGAGFLPLPHGVGHRQREQFDASGRRQPLFPGPRRPGPRGRRPAAPPDRHGPRRHAAKCSSSRSSPPSTRPAWSWPT